MPRDIAIKISNLTKIYHQKKILIDNEHDNPSIGLILCANRNSNKVQYAKAGLDENSTIEYFSVVKKDEDRNVKRNLKHSPLGNDILGKVA